MRGIRLTQAVCQPVCIAPLYLCPRICVGDCQITCLSPCTQCEENGTLMVEQNLRVRVPVIIGANARLGCARFICVKGGIPDYGYHQSFALPPDRRL